MQIKKKFFFVCSFFLLGLLGCSEPKNPSEVRVGTMAGPETKLVEAAQESAKKQGVVIKIIEFSDYAMPNAALSEGSIDVNIFQHQPYLDEAIKNKHYALVPIGKTFIYPMGIYSKTLKRVGDVQKDAKIAIPNDPSNEARALLLLEKAGLITLKKNAGSNATKLDVLSNPKNLDIKELDAAQLPRVLDDVAFAVINSNYAIAAGFSPQKDSIFLENKQSPYANLIVVRKQDIHNPKLNALVHALHSDSVLKTAKESFNGGAVQAW
jgi:D-methionine transport system substrate-binding protein